MRSGPGIAAAALGCVFLAHGPAKAQDAQLQAVFTGSVGFTDNVSSAIEPAPWDEQAEGPQAGGFGTATPGLIFSYVTPRVSQTLSYTFAANYFFGPASAASYTNTVAYAGRFITSPTTTLSLGATGTQGQLNTLQLTQPAALANVQTVESGTTDFLQGGFNEGFSKQLSPVISLGQAASFIVYDPLGENPPRTYNATNTFSAQRLFRHDTAALALTSAYTHFENVEVPVRDEATGEIVVVGDQAATEFDVRDQLINTLVASWQHDFGHYFSIQIDAGVTQAMDLSGDLEMLWEPAGLAALRYTRDVAQAELAYSHAAALNVFLSQNALVDQVTLRLGAPLSQAARLDVEGSAGAQYARSLEDGDEVNPSTVLLADVALVWSPITPIPDFGLSLRYQHTTQFAEELVVNPDVLPLQTTWRDTELVRNAVILSVSGAFPATTATSTRIVMTQPFGSSGPTQTQRRQAAPSEPTEEESSPASEAPAQ